MSQITALLGHTVLLRSMYRRILRGLAKIRQIDPVVDLTKGEDGLTLHRELVKASKNPKLYGEYLRTELKYRIDEEFRKYYPRINERSLYPKLVEGEKLVGFLQDVRKETRNCMLWSSIIEILVANRQRELDRNCWKRAYLSSKAEIDQGRDKEVNPLIAKRRQSSRLREYDTSKKYTSLTASHRRKALKKAIGESEENAAFVVRNYLKKLQLNGRIPNPYKLPYVPASLTRQTINMPKENALIPGSTKTVVVDAAYDSQYIESIIKPEVEFKINQHHYMAPLEKIVNEDGPYKVKISASNAGIMKAYYIRLPFPKFAEMRQIAVDIKRLVRTARKLFLWNLQLSNAPDAKAKRLGLGYHVRGSEGFSTDELMYPREYYENLVNREANWELLMELEEQKAKYGEDFVLSEQFNDKFQKRAREVFDSWLQPLRETTNILKEDVRLYHKKYNVGIDDPIWKKQLKYQKMMNESFEDKVTRYTELLTQLEKDRVFMHSELYRTSPVTQDYTKTMVSEEGKSVKYRHGIPETERKGQGKRLGDYLEDMGFKGYKMGYKFARRFRFLQKRDDKSRY